MSSHELKVLLRAVLDNTEKNMICCTLWPLELYCMYSTSAPWYRNQAPTSPDHRPHVLYSNSALCSRAGVGIWGQLWEVLPPRVNWVELMSAAVAVNPGRVSDPSFTFISHSGSPLKRTLWATFDLFFFPPPPYRISFPSTPWFYNCQLPAQQ